VVCKELGGYRKECRVLKVVITGGAGFIGSNLAQELADKEEVTILDDLSTGRIENIQNLIKERKVRFVKGSITHYNLLKNLFQDCDYVFHQAAIASAQRSLKNPLAINEVNVRGTLNVLIAARDSDIKKVIYASSSSVYGNTPNLPKREDMRLNPISPYAVSKLAGEYYCNVFSKIYGIKTVCLRLFNVYGPRQDPSSEYAAVIPRFITRILNKKPPIIFGDGEQTRDFTFIKDAISANLLAMERGEGVFNIASGESISINELASKIMEISGTNITPIYERPREGDIRYSLADLSLAREKLGYNPRFTLVQGLKETIKWFRS
jgi:UDP-glucose 4-epimerase